MDAACTTPARRMLVGAAVVFSLTLGVAAENGPQSAPAGSAQQSDPADSGAMPVAQQNAILRQFCVTCHNDEDLTGGLSLATFDAGHPDPALAALIVTRLKAGEMPPKQRPRPDAGTLYALISALSMEAAARPAASHAAPAAPNAAPATSTPQVIAFPHDGDLMSAEIANTVVHQICTQCHTDDRKPGGVSFEHFDVARLPDQRPLVEAMIAKLRAGMMPPDSAPKRPDAASIHALAVSLEDRVDRAAALRPDPGTRSFQRLNRAEYATAVHDLLDLDVDVATYLPDDVTSAGFDVVADAQTMSPTLMQSYLSAADYVSRLAIGNRSATATSATYAVSEDESQVEHVDGTPFGTRGGIAFVHTFPADGDYVFKVMLHGTVTGELFGNTTLYLTHQDEPVVIAIDGKIVGQVTVNPYMDGGANHGNGLRLDTDPIHIQAGPHRIAVAFPRRFSGPVDDLVAPIDRSLADSRIGTGFGVTTLPHLQEVTVAGPFKVSGVSQTPSRRRIFGCYPSAPADERPCALRIVRRLSSDAFRRPVSERHLGLLMRLYDQGRHDGGFERGIQVALQGILADPMFLFRFEQVPASARPGQPYRVTDLDLASRLSYFLWSAPPDAELRRLASTGRLHERAVLDAQVLRMLKDPRAIALSTRFAAQWLRLQDVENIRPNAFLYPEWDLSLSHAFRRETELFFNSLVRGDRNVLDLLTGDYTFVNGRLAAFYGIPGVAGSEFRRVSLAGTHRQGLLGQGSILLQTSVADRTDPVLRGKWVLEVLLGQPPPPPPPNVPPLEATSAISGGRPLTVRQRMEEHRKNPFCASCHRMIDPIGLALENFDVTGAYRVTDNSGLPVDSTGTLYDGTKIDGLPALEQALLAHQDTVLRVFTENLMTYALGRRVEFYDMPTVRRIIGEAVRHGNRFSSFVLGIVNSDAFQKSRGSTLSADAGRPARKGH